MVRIEQLSSQQIKQKDIDHWPVWVKEPSRFPWHYDTNEQCFIIEGEVIVETPETNYTLKPGDFVTFTAGLDCVWDVKKTIRKHYHFD